MASKQYLNMINDMDLKLSTYWKKISYKYEPGWDDLIQNGIEKKNIKYMI